MPNPYFAQYQYWKQMFEKAREYFSDEDIFVGHSMGAIFLLKYLENNSLRASTIHLIGACHADVPEEKIGSFLLTPHISDLHITPEKLHFYHSEDDPLIPFSEHEYFRKLFPQSHFHSFIDR